MGADILWAKTKDISTNDGDCVADAFEDCCAANGFELSVLVHGIHLGVWACTRVGEDSLDDLGPASDWA